MLAYFGSSAAAEEINRDPLLLSNNALEYEGHYKEPERRELRFDVPGEFFSSCGRFSLHVGENTGAAIGYTDYADTDCSEPDYQFRVGGRMNGAAAQLRFYVKCWFGCSHNRWN
jgi:hypothetical protein